jgi:hypothetical protein
MTRLLPGASGVPPLDDVASVRLVDADENMIGSCGMTCRTLLLFFKKTDKADVRW